MKLWKMYKNLAVQTKASIWYTVCNFFQKGISFIVVPFYVRLLTTSEYGQWSVFQSWRDILIIFASLNLYAGVYTKTLVDNRDDRDGYTSSMQGLGTVITLAFFLIYWIAHETFEKILGLNTPLTVLLFLYFITYPAFSFWGTRQRVEYHYKLMVIVTAVVSVLTPTVSIALLMKTQLKEQALILGYLLVQCSVGMFFYILQFIKGKCFFNKKYWIYAARFNIPLIPHYLSLIVLGQSDRIMIQYFCGESDAGIYSFAYQIAATMSILLSAINGSRVPWSYEQLRDRNYSSLRAISNALCVLIGAITLLASLMAPDMISILGTTEYRAAVYVIPIVVLGVYFTYCYDMFCTVEFYYGTTKFIMVASAIGALTNIVLNIIFIPRFGFAAAAYTTLASYIMLTYMHYLFMHRVMCYENIKEKIYDIRFTAALSATLSICVFLSMLTYSNTWIRYGFLVILLTALYFNRKRITDIVRSMKGKGGTI